MQVKQLLLISFLIVGYADYSDALHANGVNVQTTYWSETKKTKYACSFWSWGRCTKYVEQIHTKYQCYSGWTQKYWNSNGCELALCSKKTNLNGACNIKYGNDFIRTRAGYYYQSGGSCTAPDTCSGCNTGFYSDGPYCRICAKIDNCNHRVCTSSSDHQCQWCEGELQPNRYYRAYTQHVDKTKCQKACSWRTDSSRCFPGVCTDELASNCVCSTNFEGTHCQDINEAPEILWNYCEFTDTGGHNKLKNDPNWIKDDPHPIIWTNFVAYTRIKFEINAKYLQPVVTIDSTHYVKDFRVGVIEEKVTLSYYKGSTFKDVKTGTSPRMDKNQPVDKNLETWDKASWSGYEHDDKVIVAFTSTNGGYVKVADREQNVWDKVTNTYYYNGQTATREFEYHWDLVDPVHCSVTSGTSCSSFVSTATDITNNPSITFTWGGWSDALAGIDRFEYDLFELKDVGTELVDGMDKKQSNANVPATDSSVTLAMTEPGMYSLHMTAVDKAGNYMTGRSLFLFDDESVVDKQGDPTYCPTASEDTSYIWVVEDTLKVKVQFKDRFINTRHKHNKWLNRVQTYNPQKVIYEDLYGDRTNEPIFNIHAIVDFQVSFEVHSAPSTLKDSRALTSISKLKNQYDILTLNWADGDRLTSTVKAFDVLSEYNEETIVIYRDATPPLLENLWLTKGDRLNISVHSLEDFTKMTIEWEAYDMHSGLDSVNWKLFDHKTGDVHGYEDIIAQGSASDLSSCNSTYGSYARGANCYCTPFQGCFHRHFQIKPEIKLTGGLLQNKDKGMHEYDYYIEVSITNIAKITTVLKKKITIDISPPHSGMVHDGIKGNPEIDYQQGTDLKAYWEEFFDRESGVFFYQYIVGTSCAGKNDFTLDGTNPNLVETYNTFGSHTASVNGTYYFTVVAYNRALDPSDPVCSDGVTIDSSVPAVQEIVVENSLITGGLITDSTFTNYYILGSDRMRRLITDVTADCVSKATSLNDIDLYPQEKFDNGSLVEVDGHVFCGNSSGAPSNIGLTLYKSSLMEISWEPVDIPAKVYDYELGFSSTSGSAAPDIMAFESTKQHAHHRVVHSNIPDGTQFYIIIKTISKSNVEGLTTLGPCFMDTTPPEFVGGSSVFTVELSGDYLITSWPHDAVSDSEEFFELDYKFAVGHTAYGTDIHDFLPLQSGDICTFTYPPNCTAVDITNMDWFLHGHHTYYVSIKITNSAGLVTIQTSDSYIHDVQLPAEGVIIDVDPQNFVTDIPLKDIEDIDFQTSADSMSARWSGFAHPHLDVTYNISIGTTAGGSDVVSMKDVDTSLSHQESGLALTPFETYYFTVTAISSAGNTVVSSDGVTIVTENYGLSGITINDGKPCNMTDLTVGHHEDDNRLYCADDVDVQMSTSSLKAYWSVPVGIQSYTRDAYIAIEKRTGTGNMWTSFRDFVHYSTVFGVSIDDLTLDPGIKYRIVLKLCARTICFQTIHTDGVMVIANPPTAGDITIEHLNTTEGNGVEKLSVSFTQFYDPDIEDTTEKYAAVDKYEFAITDNSVLGKPYMTWTNLVTYTTNANQISFEYELNGTMDFSKCKRFSIRGYNNVKLYTTISTEVKDCEAYNPILIIPNIVIDAVGAPDALDSHGKMIYLEENAYWPEPDMDYTPYKNVISAAWPTLRHKDYDYAILDAKTIDVTTYYHQISQLSLTKPCDHPDSIRCGHTINGFMNELFSNNELVHGTRYTVCVHANPIQITRETWIEYLEEINSCSDGIVVDLTPPVAGRLWIGLNPGIVYQTSNTDLYINWDGFHDVEEYDTGPHATGIKEYILGIGTTPGGNDVYSFENVGVVQHKALHGLSLQNGYVYYATLKAVDFAKRETEKISAPITIDVTPPDRTDNPITLINRHITSTTEISPCWKEVFMDVQSGLDYYLWSVGSQPGYTDMMTYIKTTDECGITDKNNPLSLLDGHSYYINVRAFNKAGLSSVATSWAFELDTTPPTPGHVYDGDKDQVTGSIKDIDYQIETKVLHAHWEGFHESHSTIKDYYVSIGTCPQCEDILGQQAIGIAYEFTLENTHLGTGLRYYTTVTACNTAEMCTTVTSDGVIIDNSPPTPGTVQDGTGYYDTEYQSLKNYISAKWYGFDDAQSGLEKYEWRVGTKPGYSDIVPTIELHLTETAALLDSSSYNLSLPINTRMYITVRAYNKAGLWSESSSSGFSVDDTPPVLSKVTTFSNDFGITVLTQIYRTTMKVEWEVEDAESFIKRQYLSIKSHIGGEFMLSSQPVNGIARSYVFTGLDLHDGVTYYVTLITCNSADICISDTSQGMFVDSTPPSRGMFAVSTDHASDPDTSRNEHGWMTFGSNAVYLAWLGFSDIHSQIDHYMVTVGTSYMEKNLNKDLKTKYVHVDSNTDHGDEGKVQLFKIDTVVLTQYEEVYITLWAVNKVGLRSQMIHSAFKKTPPSYLDLVRRCDAISCEGHCVCSPQDRKCPFNPSLGNCTDVSDGVFSGTQYTLLLVKDTNGYTTDDQAVTASDSVLRASWIISQQFPSKPLWYEWSVGYEDEATPIGIYDSVKQKVWHDAGQLMDTIFTVGPDKELLENTIKYSVFVRIWYSSDTYAVFKTDGIVVMTQMPGLATVRGTAVIEKVLNTNVKDADYMRIGRPITFMWKDKFLNAAATIKEYKLYISSFPGGYDIMTIPTDLDGTAEGFNMSRVNLSPGIKYYSNVIAYNYAGVHTTSTSDGFIVDHVDPSAGIVYDGLGGQDVEYKNSSDIVEAHWHGFIDTESGIQSYRWCVGLTTFVHKNYDQSECDILPWTNVGLHVSVSRNLSTDIPHGTKIYNKVYAVDNVGRMSSIVISDGAIVDKTPPVSEKFIHIDDNMVDNPSFEDTSGDLVSWENVSTTDICLISSSYHPLSWIPDVSTCMAVISSQVNLAKDGQSFLFIRGNVQQNLVEIKAGCFYKISFYSSHLPITDSVGANKEGFIQLGDDKQVFLIYTKPYRHDGHGEGKSRAEISWHAHTFYFKATNNEVNITIGSMDMTTGIFIDNLSVQKVNLTTASPGGHVIGHVVYLHEWSSIHGSWSFADPESPVIDYSWAIGYASGGTQIQPFRSVGLMNFGFNNNVTLVHNTYIYITAIATNGADLRGISYSDPILVDLTPPDIKFVNDGLGGDEDAWEFNEVVANWDYEDPESGILFCKWAVGYQPGGIELLPYTVVTALSAYKEFPYNVLIGRTIYTTLTCENNAGLISTMSANGVKISNQPPSIASAVVETMPLSMTEYTPQINNQGVTDNIRLKWTGFADDIGVERFKVFYNKDGLSEMMFFADVQDVLYAHFTDTTLTEGSYDFSVQAVNKLFKISNKVKANSTVDTSVPTVDNSKNLGLSWIDNKVVVSWDTIFSSDDALFYEVSSGSAQSGVNIIQWQETSNTSITFGIPASVSASTGLPVHVTVKAVSIGGHSAVKVGQFILP
ncbi:uncharacterized protein LOC143085385 [Mytilus galloprovincialis]|uniref:uncharacterized protein LOC143085385 n=1 Tax=Mytilus galloprovincialis TaxID=29158 RepID=UPI003F7C4F79